MYSFTLFVCGVQLSTRFKVTNLLQKQCMCKKKITFYMCGLVFHISRSGNSLYQKNIYFKVYSSYMFDEIAPKKRERKI